MIRRLLHSLDPAVSNRSVTKESDLTPAVAGMVSLMVAILAMIWFFMTFEIQPAGESIQQPAETDLMVNHHKDAIIANYSGPDDRPDIWERKDSVGYLMT